MLKVDAGEDWICVNARNDQWGISEKIVARVTELGSALIPGRPFQLFLNSLEGRVSVRTDHERERLIVSTTEASMELATGSLESWLAPPIDDGPHQYMPLADMKRIGQVVFAAARDLSRPLLTGVRLQAMSASATDTRRIASAKLSVELPNLTVPAEFLMYVSRQANEDLEVWSDPSGIHFVSARTSWSARELVGDYPNLAKYLELERPNRVSVARLDLLEALKRMTAFDSDHAIVRITLRDDSAVLWTEHAEVGEISDRIDASSQFRGNIWFSLRVLNQAIEAHDAEDAVLEIKTPSDPVLLHGSFISQVIMPRIELA
jgi:DNA polymerase III sliding clamp (beta) subunit (PCNA family)